MAGKNLLYIGAGILFLIGICLLGYGILNVIGSTSAQGSASWLTFGLGFGAAGVLFLGAGAGLIYAAQRGSKTEVIQQVTMIAGAPTVECPYCGTTYQLTEEPKW
jgi:hypothetical protein